MPRQLAKELTALDEIVQGIAAITDLAELKALLERIKAARHDARSLSLGLEIQNHVAELTLRVERQAGKLLSGVIKRGGDRKSPHHEESPRLADLGIDHNQSARWQHEASVPDDVFEGYIRAAKTHGIAITASNLQHLPRKPE